MTRVKILADFEGYPDDTDASRTFYKEGDVVEVPDAFAALVEKKGLAEPLGGAPAGGFDNHD